MATNKRPSVPEDMNPKEMKPVDIPVSTPKNKTATDKKMKDETFQSPDEGGDEPILTREEILTMMNRGRTPGERTSTSSQRVREISQGHSPDEVTSRRKPKNPVERNGEMNEEVETTKA